MKLRSTCTGKIFRRHAWVPLAQIGHTKTEGNIYETHCATCGLRSLTCDAAINIPRM